MSGERDNLTQGEEGMVTVETAIGLMSVVLVLIAVLVALSVGVTKGQVCQAAREATRAATLGSSSPALGGGSHRPLQVNVSESGHFVTAVVTAPAVVLGGWSVSAVSCTVSGVREPYLQWSGTGG